MSDRTRGASRDRLLEFHQELENAAKQYKERYQIPSTVPESFLVDFCKMSRDMEFELLDNIVHHIKSLSAMDEIRQKFILGLLKGDMSVSDDRFENLVHLAEITKLGQDILLF